MRTELPRSSGRAFFIAHSDEDKAFVREIKAKILAIVKVREVRRKWPKAKEIDAREIYFDEDHYDATASLEGFAREAALARCMVLVVPKAGVHDNSFIRKELLAFLCDVRHAKREQPDPTSLSDEEITRAIGQRRRLVLVDRHDRLRWRGDRIDGLGWICREGCLAAVFAEERGRLRETARSAHFVARAALGALWDQSAEAVLNKEDAQRRRNFIAWVTGLGCATVVFAVMFLLMWAARHDAERREEELRDRVYLSAAERAISSGDRTNASLFLKQVGSKSRNARWVALAISATNGEVASWQADERLLGAAGEDRFVSMSADGSIHVRRYDTPDSSIELRWPRKERWPAPERKASGHAWISLAQHRFLLVSLPGAAALWDLDGDGSPMLVGSDIGLDAAGARALVVDDVSASVRRLDEPSRVLSSFSFAQDRGLRFSGWYKWLAPGAVIGVTGSTTAKFLGPSGPLPVPFDSVPEWLHGALLDDAVLSINRRDEENPHSSTTCLAGQGAAIRGAGSARWAHVERSVTAHALTPGWPVLGTWTVCDSLLPSQRTISGNRWAAWDKSGLIMITVTSSGASSVHVNWSALPGCADQLRTWSCSLDFAGADGALRVRGSDPTNSRQEVYVISRTGTVSEAHVETHPDPENVFDEFGRPHRIIWSDESLLAANEDGRLEVWRKPLAFLAPAPVSFDLPFPEANRNPTTRIVRSDNWVVAGLRDASIVRVWWLPERRSSRRHHGASWLRDGRVVVWDIFRPNGAPDSLEIKILDPETSDAPPTWSGSIGHCPFAVRESGGWNLPDRVVLSQDSRKLFVLGGPSKSASWSIDMESKSCTRLEPYAIVDDSGRWIVSAASEGVRVWRTDALDRPFVLTTTTAHSPIFSAAGDALIVSTRPEPFRGWDLSLAANATAAFGPLSVKGLASGSIESLSPTGRYAIVRNEHDGVRDLSTGDMRPLMALPDRVARLVFSRDERRLAALGWDSVVRIWNLPEQHEPIVVRPDVAVTDIRWDDGDRLAVLYLDGTSSRISIHPQVLSEQLTSNACILAQARIRFLEEEPEVARAEYQACMTSQSGRFQGSCRVSC